MQHHRQYAGGAGITAAAGTRPALHCLVRPPPVAGWGCGVTRARRRPPCVAGHAITYYSSLLHGVTYGVICAPAVFLGCGSCVSGFLSGIEPRFSGARQHHGRQRPSRQKCDRPVDRGERRHRSSSTPEFSRATRIPPPSEREHAHSPLMDAPTGNGGGNDGNPCARALATLGVTKASSISSGVHRVILCLLRDERHTLCLSVDLDC